MREVITMWRNTQMVVLTAVSAAVYAALLIPFKAFPILPGFSEIRPAAVAPVVFGWLFGPAGAWGAAIGNLIGDFFGTLGLGSIFGMIGNFCFGLVAYKIFDAMKRSLHSERKSTHSEGAERRVVWTFPEVRRSSALNVTLRCSDHSSFPLSA